MKLLVCFILLSTLAVFFVGADGSQQPDINDYDRRLWSYVNKESETYVALHLLHGIVKLIFPENEFPGIQFRVPSSTSACEAVTLTAKFLMMQNNDFLECRFRKDTRLVADIFENCDGRRGSIYSTGVKWNRNTIESEACFRNGYAFSSDGSGKSQMKLAVEGILKCPAYFILPPSVKFDTLRMPQADRLPLNETEFPGDPSDWWKKSNDPKLPKQISFVDGNPIVDVLKIAKQTLLSFRIGTNQVIPAFKLNFDADTCDDAQVSLYLNGLVSDECAFTVAPKPEGYDFTSKETEHRITTLHPTRTLLLMFAKAKVYAKVVENGEIQSLQEFDICDISNFAPADQFSLRASFVGTACARASIELEAKDVQDGIEVLVAPASAASGDNIIQQQNETDVHDREHSAATQTLTSTENASAASATIGSWVFAVIGIAFLLVVLITVALVLGYFCWYQKRRQAKASSPKESKRMSLDEDDKKSQDLKTAEPPSGGLHEPTFERPPETDQYVNMYEFTLANGESAIWDYHAGEAPFKATIDFDDKKVCRVPAAANYRNFWFCLGRVFSYHKKEAPVFADKYRGREAVNFLKRDLVTEADAYPPFRLLANRMLERGEHDVPVNQKDDPFAKKIKPVYTLRSFVICYEPLTLEVHCRGRCPLFLFEVYKECKDCKKILKELEENNWLKSSATCHEEWDTFLCRVKRTPCDSHQFLSFNGKDDPTNPELANHVFIFRGDVKSKEKETRKCTRKCSYSSMAHSNKC